MNAPATAPIGPSTTAPDTAPSAASVARSWASAAEGASNRIIAAAVKVLAMARSVLDEVVDPRRITIVLVRNYGRTEKLSGLRRMPPATWFR